MNLHSWGRYPLVKNQVIKYENDSQIKSLIESESDFITHGNGRSYGDSALNKTIVHTRPHDYFISFNEEEGLLHVQSGTLLSEVLEHFVPRGWFLKVTPGTKLITIGGAIASDVHGKNHHVAGCFSECIQEFEIMLADGNTVTCSKEATPELFQATCGGQGLTGIILDAKIYLKKINSQYIDQTTIKTKNLKETFEAFEAYQDMSYSVAWIDCLAKGGKIGKCLLTVGDFRDDGKLDYKLKKKRVFFSTSHHSRSITGVYKPLTGSTTVRSKRESPNRE
jgi:decaprenylphospho-beta-D-ribofuranose 2-oxidase